MKTKIANSSASPARKKPKTSAEGAYDTKTIDAKTVTADFDPTDPLVSLPQDALTAVLCRSPSKDYEALWKSCKTIRSTLDSNAFVSERVATGYAEVTIRHIGKEELWESCSGKDDQHDPTWEEYDAEKSARLKEEEMRTCFSDLGNWDESYGYHDIYFDVQVDGIKRGSIHLVLFPRSGRIFHEATDAHSSELQEVGWTLCDQRGRPKVKSIKDADTDQSAAGGGFLHVVSVRIAEPCRPSDNTDVASRALRMAITHPKLQGKWTLATSIADKNVYFNKADNKKSEKEKSKRREECMKLDSMTFIRIGYQQIPEMVGPSFHVNFFFALPRFLEKPLLSYVDASKVALLKCPELPPRPKGADEKLLDLLMRSCYGCREALDMNHRLLRTLETKVNETRSTIASMRRQLDEEEESCTAIIGSSDEVEDKELAIEAVKAKIDEKRSEIDKLEAELNEADLEGQISKGKDQMQEDLHSRYEGLREKVSALIQGDGASIRKAFALHCASRFRLNNYFDFLLDLVPANERNAAINEVDFADCTPLFTAAMGVPDDISQANEQYDFVEKLLKLGADKNHVDSKGLSAVGVYRTAVQSREDFDAIINSYSGRGGDDDDNDWEPIHERMEELLMPDTGETEADRNTKKSSEDDEEDEESEDEFEEDEPGEEEEDEHGEDPLDGDDQDE